MITMLIMLVSMIGGGVTVFSYALGFFKVITNFPTVWGLLTGFFS